MGGGWGGGGVLRWEHVWKKYFKTVSNSNRYTCIFVDSSVASAPPLSPAEERSPAKYSTLPSTGKRSKKPLSVRSFSFTIFLCTAVVKLKAENWTIDLMPHSHQRARGTQFSCTPAHLYRSCICIYIFWSFLLAHLAMPKWVYMIIICRCRWYCWRLCLWTVYLLFFKMAVILWYYRCHLEETGRKHITLVTSCGYIKMAGILWHYCLHLV